MNEYSLAKVQLVIVSKARSDASLFCLNEALF